MKRKATAPQNPAPDSDPREPNPRVAFPRLRFPEFKGEGGWRFENGDVLFDPISDKDHDSDLPILAITQEYGAIPRDMIDYQVAVTDKSVESYKVVQVGDFIISLRSFQGGIEYSRYKGICSPAYIILRKKRTNISDHFFRFYFKTDRFIASMNGKLEGIRDGKMVSYAQFSELLLPSPSKSEQQKIADCFSSLDDLVAAHNRKLDAFKAHKKGLMQQLFPVEGEAVPRLRFPEFKDAGEWVERKIGDVFVVTRGEVLSMTLVKCFSDDEYQFPVYSSQTKNQGLAGYYSQYLFENAITWTTDGANAGDVNFRQGKFYCTNVCGVLLNDDGWANAFVAALLNTVTRNYVSYVGNPKLMNGIMSDIIIPFPSLPEQQKIAECLSSLDSLIAAEAKEIEALKVHKKGLMQALFPDPAEADA